MQHLILDKDRNKSINTQLLKKINSSRVKERRKAIIRDAIRARTIPLDQYIKSGISFILSARAIGRKRDQFKASMEINQNE